MKKTMKRFLTTALAITMTVTMFALPVSAGSTDTKTFVLMNDDMSTAIQTWCSGKTAESSGYEAYFAGKQWGYGWGLTTNQISVADGNIVIKSETTGNAGGETVITKHIFSNSDLYSKSNIAITYDINTGVRSTEAVTIYNKLNNSINMSSYNSKTGVFKHEGYNGKSYTLSENTEYSIVHNLVYDGALKNHMLTITITDKAGNASITDATIEEGSQQVSTVINTVWDFYKTDITTLTQLNYRVYRNEKATVDGEELFTYQNIKIEQTVTGDIINFGGVEYTDDGIQLDENMADVAVADLKVTPPETEGYADGYIWAHYTNGGWAADGVFENDGTYLWAKAVDAGTTNIVSKKFDPIKSGDTLTLTGFYRTSKLSGKDGGAAIQLRNDDGTFTLDAIEISKGSSQGYRAATLGTNMTANYWATYDTSGTVFVTNNYNFDLTDKNYDGAYFNMNTDIPLTLTMSPNAENPTMYDVSVATGVDGTKTATRQITAEEAASLTTVTIRNKSNWFGTTTGNIFGVKNINVTTTAAEQKEALAVGENTVYLPVENVTGHAVNYAIVAAVYENGVEMPKDFAVATYSGHQKGIDNLAIEGVTITDATKEYVKLFVFDTFGSLVPYTTPISSIAAE